MVVGGVVVVGGLVVVGGVVVVVGANGAGVLVVAGAAVVVVGAGAVVSALLLHAEATSNTATATPCFLTV